jgi:hypothetical protein
MTWGQQQNRERDTQTIRERYRKRHTPKSMRHNLKSTLFNCPAFNTNFVPIYLTYNH